MGNITNIEWYKNPEMASEYYCSRLLHLTEFSKILNGNYFFIESDDLLDETNFVLENLTNWLDLPTPLNNSYTEFDNTGKPGYGDPSEKIHARKLIKTKSYPDIRISQKILQKAKSYYERCKASLELDSQEHANS
ncbi:MAG: hypothetical protein AAGB35_06790 [Pseudomonadota bacterium]